ncbi:Gti1/Pac2 family-domain-containing protein [Radiomyces spectabilis]|uniref:Gti1/Pac2 family-domain-containing protein n=1 Tax=Radiomyces spectabilis TaxID=64574 RepID=UPI00221F057B|nr:Gti1/Pac2 family-domain-containing protein [Radiomyces spectabilis]KAI8364683.1 Gti1/Pac2 family-domain-containing protein [Radiomyces spectabilis]
MQTMETFHGFIETTTDTLLIFEACRRGIFHKINRRLQERERGTVQSGTVFVFDEKESGIKRWTDGLVWSPSRILGNFLIYRELDARDTGHGKRASVDRRHSTGHSRHSENTVIDRNRERALVGSLTNSYKFKKGGLIKKTMSIVVNGSAQHLISYYTKEDVLNHRLRTPCSIPELACLEISSELLMRQTFRIPLNIESNASFDDSKRSSMSSSPDSATPVFSSSLNSPHDILPFYQRPDTRRRSSASTHDMTFHHVSVSRSPLETMNGGYPSTAVLSLTTGTSDYVSEGYNMRYNVRADSMPTPPNTDDCATLQSQSSISHMRFPVSMPALPHASSAPTLSLLDREYLSELHEARYSLPHVGARSSPGSMPSIYPPHPLHKASVETTPLPSPSYHVWNQPFPKTPPTSQPTYAMIPANNGYKHPGSAALPANQLPFQLSSGIISPFASPTSFPNIPSMLSTTSTLHTSTHCYANIHSMDSLSSTLSSDPAHPSLAEKVICPTAANSELQYY